MECAELNSLPEKKQAKNLSSAGFSAVLNLLDKWGWTAEEKQKVLQIKKSVFFKCQANPSLANLSGDQLERISYLLNIHQALRIVFSNPENVYGFVNMPNHNEFFYGKTQKARYLKVLLWVLLPLFLWDCGGGR